MRKIVLSASFFVMTPVLIFVSILYLSYLMYNQKIQSGKLIQNTSHTIAFAALPSSENIVEDQIVQKDSKIELVRQFFERYNSPLTPFAKDVVDAAQTYGIDFRLLPAIAMQESNLCHKAPVASYNCWGFGIYGNKITRFENYQQAIQTVTKTLALDYKRNGLETPQEIMKRYTPQSKGKWAYAVNYFMELLQ